jgi:hypothetical protein
VGKQEIRAREGGEGDMILFSHTWATTVAMAQTSRMELTIGHSNSYA